ARAPCAAPPAGPGSPRLLLVAQPPSHSRLQREQLDETRRRGLREKAAGLGKRGQRRVVDRVLALARDDLRAALVQAHADLPAHACVDRVDIRIDVLAQRLPPQPGVDEVRPLAIERRLELVLVDRAYEALELLVRRED